MIKRIRVVSTWSRVLVDPWARHRPTDPSIEHTASVASATASSGSTPWPVRLFAKVCDHAAKILLSRSGAGLSDRDGPLRQPALVSGSVVDRRAKRGAVELLGVQPHVAI